MNKQARFSKAFLTFLWFGSFGTLGLGIGLGMSNHTRAVDPQEKAGVNQPATKIAGVENAGGGTIKVSPPPDDINDLSMEVAALRTLYLLYAWPDRDNGSWKYHTNAPWIYFEENAKELPSEAANRKRTPAVVTVEYKRVLIELREAYILGLDDKIIDLSDRLEELSQDEDIQLDDAVTKTDNGRKNASRRLGRLTPECIVNYLNSYGKEFPSPVNLIGRTIIEREPGKIDKATREFVAKEVGWALGGFEHEKDIAKKIEEFLEKVPDSPEECRKGWHMGEPLRKEFEKIERLGINLVPKTKGQKGQKDQKEQKEPAFFHADQSMYESIRMIEHLMLEDLAELFSNPRLRPAIEARKPFLKKAGYKIEKVNVKEDPDDNK